MNPIKLIEYKGEFFKVLVTTDKSQIAVMSLHPGEDSGKEIESHRGDQVMYVIEGEAEIELDGDIVKVGQNMVFTIPAGTEHQVFNRGQENLFTLNIYAPPSYSPPR